MNEQSSEQPAVKESELLTAIRQLNAEIHPNIVAMDVTLDTSLDRELGLDSLARIELLARIERQFKITLPETVFANVETPRDLLRALRNTSETRTTQQLPERPVSLSSTAIEESPSNVQTLIEALDWHVHAHPDRTTLRIYQAASAEEILSYRQLKEEAAAIAGGLQHGGLLPGQTVAIMLPTGRDYFACFFGALLAGGIPVPIYPPARPAMLEEHVRRHAKILTNSLTPILITVSEAKPVARLLKSHVEALEHIVTPEDLRANARGYQTPVLQGNNIAFLQYTSGSTADPKGVVLTHENLLANIRIMGQAINANSSDVFVSWLPLYHDMGLIGAWLSTLYHAIPLVIMSPLSFLSRPTRWLQAINQYRGTLSAAPNFAYEFCLRRIDDAEIAELDLSSWRIAFNGAEVVSPVTIDRFCERFARFGFKREVMTPVYGLAEISLGLTFPPLKRGPLIDCVERAVLTQTGRAQATNRRDASALCLASCGAPLPGYRIRILDTSGRELPERHEGRLQFRGPSATSGYFRNPDATRRLFDNGWIESGDLAYFADGEIFITGRTKDVIIHGGRNIYPDEIEQAVGNIQGILKGCVAVFGSHDSETGTERLVVLAETRKRDKEDVFAALRTQINATVIDLTGAPPDEICLAPPHSVLKTSSGKIRRSASRDLYERKLIDQSQAVWQQTLRLMVSAIVPQLHRIVRAVATRLYGAYAWIVFTSIMILALILVGILPRLTWRWTAIHHTARLCAVVCGLRPRITGREHLLSQGRINVFVANHASYLDSFLLVATLPEPVRFVAKAELKKQIIAGNFLRRIGCEFVERFDRKKSVDDARYLTQIAHDERPLLFFPEGTFTQLPGLRPFHLGAFMIATEIRAPVIPIALRGTRFVLPSDSWFPRLGPIAITIGAPITPGESQASDTWNNALVLRDAVRAYILHHSGEPDFSHNNLAT